MPDTNVVRLLAKLEACLHDMGPVGVAVSGGVDSMTLAYIAHRANNTSVMFHALSPAVPESATQRVHHYAQHQGWNLELINAGEMADPEYLKNPLNRCYFCKSNLYKTISDNTTLTIASGTNVDDLDDFRPGLEAAKQLNVRHPYVEAGIEKNGIRQLAKYFALTDLQALPASPCLSSRISTGIAINEKLLLLIDQVENSVRELLQRTLKPTAVRCRILPEHIAIQLDTEQLVNDSASYAQSIRQRVAEILIKRGFTQYSDNIRIEPYTKGSAFIQLKNISSQ